METVLNAFSACFVLLLIMAVGYFMGYKGWMGPPEKLFLSKYIMSIAVPCLCIRGLVTNLGKFLDPLADKALTTAAFLGFMTKRPSVALCWAVMLILSREFMVTSVRLLAAKDGVVVAASMAGKMKTVMQMAAILYTLAAMQIAELVSNAALCRVLLAVGDGLIWVAAVLTVISGIQYVWNLRHYFKEN